MATQQSVKSSNERQASLRIRFYRLPLVARRFAATVVEVSLVAASALAPYSIGVVAQSHAVGEPVPLNPVLASTQEAIAKTLGLPLHDSNQQVPPLTNLFWCGALFAPVVVVGWQLNKLGKTGQTPAKAMFGVRVVNASGEPPGIVRALFREGVGRWGLPVGVAYTIWQYTGAFPDGGILLGLASLLVVGESAILLLGRAGRTLHDRLAGTFVLDGARQGRYAGRNYANGHQQGHHRQPIRMEVQSNWTEPDEEASTYRRRETVTTIVLTTVPNWPRWHLWQWMRQNPGFTLLIVAFAAMASVLGTFVGTQIYIQSQANRRVFKQQNNEVFLALVKQLSATSPNAVEERRGALLALARLDDPRAVPFLVDLLGQEKTQELIDAIGQALVSAGPQALPNLQRLNQSLENDQQTLQRQGTPEEQQLIARQRASQRAIAKILTVYSGQIHKADLSRTELGAITSGTRQFALVLDKADLSGINFRGANLTNASLRGSSFHGPGEDGRFGTFDDWISDLSGAELKEANLTEAMLQQVVMDHTDLTRAILSRANLNGAKLSNANLSSAQLMAADLREAILENASLTGAELTNANLSQSNLYGARLKQVSALGTQFQFAELTRSNWEGADLTKANLHHANLRDADLNSTKLVGADLSQAQLQNANLRNADLSSADLQGANLDAADFQGVTFTTVNHKSDQFIQSPPSAATSAHVKNVSFAKVKNLDAKQIAFICDQGGLHPKCP